VRGKEYAIPDSIRDRLPLTLLVQLTVCGEERFAVTRASLDGEQWMIMAPDGRIPVFRDAAAARRWAGRVMPRDPDAERQQGLDAVNDQLPVMFAVDVDAVSAWTRQPVPKALPPAALLHGWHLLALGAEIPLAPRVDPMYFAMAHAEGRPERLSDEEELVLSLMRLDMVMRRESSQHLEADARPWPAEAELWGADDARLVAGAMRPAIPAFVARLSGDVDDIERSLAGRLR
jgi:hypothetical protein